MIPKGETFEEKIISRVMTREEFRRRAIRYVVEHLLQKKRPQFKIKDRVNC